ncbi:hypothetical protein [Burkholderia sp. WAC0059]|uniref:hypothetical protein n=1 Tax=Burkholderia sp. WAC0059 TaxID=2066022 RepID=UPI0015E11589|nr:hypothetical protein [Burkholderia sp. WAC0059]
MRPFRRFVLNLKRDRHAWAALEAYADACESDAPGLAHALRAQRREQSDRLTHCAPTVLRVFSLAQTAAADQSDYAHSAWEHVRRHLIAVLEEAPSAREKGVDDAQPLSRSPVVRLPVNRGS